MAMAVCLAALSLLPAASAGRSRAAAWLASIPASRRASLLTAMHQLIGAEARQDWGAVYRLRPVLDRETETEAQFQRRWQETEPVTILDFEPLHTSPSNFAYVSVSEQVFDIQGCAQVERDDAGSGQEGSISAHWDDETWHLDGVHLLTDDLDDPEPCRFHAGRGLLPRGRRP